MGTIARMSVELGMDAGGFDRGIASVQKSLDSMAKKMASAGSMLSLGVTAPLAGIATMAIQSAGDFEQSLNIMQQVSGATESQMASLQAQALQLGAETSFSAGEAAAAMLELGKAGLSVDEVGAAIGGTMDLAAAGGLELAQAAEIAANAMNAFKLPASDTTDVANMLAAAANASSVEVTDLAAGMTMASSVFASNGQSIQDLTTAMGLLGNNAIKGSDAGTSLKTMLMRLTAPTDEASAAMAALGVQVYDAQGNMRDLPAIMADLKQATYGVNEVTFTSSNLTADQAERMDYLRGIIAKTQTKLADYASGLAGVAQSEADKVVATDRLNRELAAAQAEYAGLSSVGGSTVTMMNQLTAAERNAALSTIFGADAIRAVNVLLSEGETGWTDMAAAVGQQGAAADVANARMKGFGGAMEYLKGSVDSFLISTALPFLDSLSGIVRTVADAITGLGGLPAPLQNAALAFAGVMAAAGPVLLALAGVATALGFLLSPIGLVVVGVAALAAAWASNFGGIQEKTAAVWAAIQPTLTAIGNAINLVVSYLTATFETGDDRSAFGYIKKLPEWLRAPTLALGGFVAFVSFSLAQIQAGTFDWGKVLPPLDLSAMTVAFGGIMTAFAGLWAWLQVALPAALTSLQTAWDAAWPAMQATWDSTWAVLSTAFTSAQAWLETTLPAALATFQAAWDGLQAVFSATPGAISTVTATFAGLWTQLAGIGATLTAFFAPAIERLQAAFLGLPEALAPLMPQLLEMGAAFGGMLTAVQPLIFALGVALAVAANFGVNLMAAAMERLPGIVGPIIDQVTNSVKLISTVLTEVTTAIVAIANGDWSTAWESMKTVVTAFQTFVSDTWTNITTLVGNVGGAIGEAVVSTLEDMGLTAAAQAVKDIIAQIKLMGESISAVLSGDLAFSIALPDWLSKLLKWAWPAIPAVPSWITTLLAWAWPKIPSVPNWIQQLFNWRWPGLPEAPSWLADLLNWSWPAMPAFPNPFGGGQADGGPVSARTTYLVGERGPELFTPNKSGTIIPNDELGGLWGDMVGAGEGGPQVTVYATVANQIDVHAMAYQVAAEIDRWRRK